MAGRHHIRGVGDAIKRLRVLEQAFGSDGLNMEKEMLKMAEVIKGNVKSEAPRGATGNLARGVVAKNFQKGTKDKPAAFAAIDYRIAPHAHLVEYGHITASGSHTAANPFFRRGLERSRAWMMMNIRKLIEKRLSRAAHYKKGAI